MIMIFAFNTHMHVRYDLLSLERLVIVYDEQWEGLFYHQMR